MTKSISKLLTYLTFGLLLLGLTGCGNSPSHVPAEPTQTPPFHKIPPAVEEKFSANASKAPGQTPPETNGSLISPETSTPWADRTPQPTLAPDPDTWQGAYVEFMEGPELDDLFGGYYLTYSLIYVDEDDIPELVIDSGGEAGGCVILTWHNGKLDWMQTARLEFTYLERQNLLCNGSGNAGYYYDLVYTIQNDCWTLVAEGSFKEINWDEKTSSFDYAFSWNGVEVSEEEYYRQLTSVFDGKQSVEPTQYYIQPDMRSLLLAGEVSAGHRYEFLQGNVTWAEADALCKEKGGYLASITSQEEFDHIEAQLLEAGMTDLVFWVGAYTEYKVVWWDPESGNERYYGTYWLEQGQEPYGVLDYFDVLYYLWAEWRSPYDMTTTAKKDAACLFYDPGEERCYLQSMPNNPADWGFEYKGTIGYICEYEN